MTPGGAPMQPGSAADETARAGAAPRSINRRHRLTPLVERGEVDICFYSYDVKERVLTLIGGAFIDAQKAFRNLPQNGVRGVTADDADRYGKISAGDGAMPDFVAALALPDELATGLTQQFS